MEEFQLYFRQLLIFKYSLTSCSFWANTDSGCERVAMHFLYKLESQATDWTPHLRILIGFIESLNNSLYYHYQGLI